jgi:hypothetical protein
MSKFTTDLIVKVPLDGGDRVLESDLIYVSDLVNLNIVAPKGLITDYGSIPKILHNIISPTGKATYGYVIHDLLYQTGMFERSKCDAILDEAMKVLNVGWFTRKTVMAGLKVGGWVAYNNYRKREQNEKL